MMFNGVRWDVIRRPHRNPSSQPGAPRHDVYVEEPPRCPKCGLGVVETQSWLGYTWSCPECGLRKRSSQNMQAIAQALARGLH
jgi:rubredoxin